MNIVESLGSTAAIIGGGFFIGILIGYVFKESNQNSSCIVGLFLAGLEYLQYHQVASINRNKLQQISEGSITTLLNSIIQIQSS
jgi:uncharacterized membrane protein (Fun14 family)